MNKKIYKQPQTRADILCVGMSQVMDNSTDPSASIHDRYPVFGTDGSKQVPIGIRYI